MERLEGAPIPLSSADKPELRIFTQGELLLPAVRLLVDPVNGPTLICHALGHPAYVASRREGKFVYYRCYRAAHQLPQLVRSAIGENAAIPRCIRT